MNCFRLIFLVLFTTSCIACARQLPVETPAFGVTARSSADVEKAIRHALAGRGWKVVSHTPGLFKARYEKENRHSADIALSYNKSEVTISYLDSQGLLFENEEKDEGPVIHKNYNRWVRFLQQDIHRHLTVY